jgi:hypothetical protein
VRRRVVLLLALVTATVIACSTFGGADDDDENVEDAGSTNEGSSTIDGAPLDGDVSADGGAPIDDAAAGDAGSCQLVSPTGVFYEAHFDKQNCEGWQTVQGTLEWVPSPTRCGAGACKVCSTAAGETVLLRELGVSGEQGTFEARLELRGDTLTDPVTASTYEFDDGGIQIGFGQNSVPLVPGQWSPGQIIANHSQPASMLRMRVVAVVDGGGLCYFVDEIRIGHY